jgi:hypothetical protein
MTIGRLRASVGIVVGECSLAAALGEMGLGRDGASSSVTGSTGIGASATACRIGGSSGFSGAARFVFVASTPRAFSAIANPSAARAISVQVATNRRRRATPQRSSVVMPKGKYRIATPCAHIAEPAAVYLIRLHCPTGSSPNKAEESKAQPGLRVPRAFPDLHSDTAVQRRITGICPLSHPTACRLRERSAERRTKRQLSILAVIQRAYQRIKGSKVRRKASAQFDRSNSTITSMTPGRQDRVSIFSGSHFFLSNQVCIAAILALSLHSGTRISTKDIGDPSRAGSPVLCATAFTES